MEKMRKKMTENGLYLLHFDSDIDYRNSSQYGDSRHYVGISSNIPQRLRNHRLGTGSKMTKIAVDRGVSFEVTRLENGETSTIQQYKNLTNYPRGFCSKCAMHFADDFG